jgi:hypothetical protein
MRVEVNHGRRQALAVGVGHDLGVAVRFQVGKPGEGGAKVDANIVCHNV